MTAAEWKPEHYTLTQLKERGWTEALIEQHLGAPDLTRRNPFSRKKPPMRLWLMARVEALEMSGEVALRVKSAARVEAARMSAQTRAEAMVREIDALEIEVPQLSPDGLLHLACDHYNNRDRWGDHPATERSDPEFLARIQVNYLRHVMTDYDGLLDARAGRVGIRMGGHARIFRRVMDAIALHHPHLAQACEEQYAARFETPQENA